MSLWYYERGQKGNVSCQEQRQNDHSPETMSSENMTSRRPSSVGFPPLSSRMLSEIWQDSFIVKNRKRENRAWAVQKPLKEAVPNNTALFPHKLQGDMCSTNTQMVARTFPCQLHKLLSVVHDEGLESIVSWAPNGNGFGVHQVETFVAHVLPRFCTRQSKYKSFQRQLVSRRDVDLFTSWVPTMNGFRSNMCSINSALISICHLTYFVDIQRIFGISTVVQGTDVGRIRSLQLLEVESFIVSWHGSTTEAASSPSCIAKWRIPKQELWMECSKCSEGWNNKPDCSVRQPCADRWRN